MPKEVFAYVLQKCPYSRKMAKLLLPSQKKWVRRGSLAYDTLKQKYGPQSTFPIVLVGGRWVGGYDDFVRQENLIMVF